MSNKKKRNKRLRPRPSDYDDCCILCQLYQQAEEQDGDWSVSDRADMLAARMRAMQEWDGCFAGLIRAPRERLSDFMARWAEPRAPLVASAEVALAALERFWDSYQEERHVG